MDQGRRQDRDMPDARGRRAIIRAYEQPGLPLKIIAGRFGISIRTVRRYARAAGKAMRRPPAQRQA